MCGIVALLLAECDGHANQELFDSLTALQHRGQGQSNMAQVFGSILAVVGDCERHKRFRFALSLCGGPGGGFYSSVFSTE